MPKNKIKRNTEWKQNKQQQIIQCKAYAYTNCRKPLRLARDMDTIWCVFFGTDRNENGVYESTQSTTTAEWKKNIQCTWRKNRKQFCFLQTKKKGLSIVHTPTTATVHGARVYNAHNMQWWVVETVVYYDSLFDVYLNRSGKRTEIYSKYAT